MKKQVFKAVVVGLMLLLIGADAGNVTAQEPTLPPLQKKAVFTVNQSAVQVDEAGFTIDVSPYIEKDRIFLPARYLGEVLGAEVIWNEADKPTKSLAFLLPFRSSTAFARFIFFLSIY